MLAVNGADGDLWPSLRTSSATSRGDPLRVLVLYPPLGRPDYLGILLPGRRRCDLAEGSSPKWPGRPAISSVRRVRSGGQCQLRQRVPSDSRPAAFEYDQCRRWSRQAGRGWKGPRSRLLQHLLAFWSEAAVLTSRRCSRRGGEGSSRSLHQIADRHNFIPGLLSAQSSLTAN